MVLIDIFLGYQGCTETGTAMDTAKYPPANWPYLMFVALMGTVGCGFCAWAVTSQVYGEWSRGQPISSGWTWPMVFAFDLGFSIALFALYWKIYRDAKTSIGSDGITQPGIRGVRTIAWSEIVRVKSLGSLGFHIHSERQKIEVTAYSYRNAPEVVETLRSRF